LRIDIKLDIRNIDSYNKSYLEGLERSSQFSYSAQYFWWKKYSVLEKIVKKIVSENFSKSDTVRILDIGCQIGHDIFKLSEELREYKIEWYGFDVNPDFLKISNLRKVIHGEHKYFFFVSSVEQTSSKNRKFDMIICSEVLEHINETEDSASNLRNLLKINSFLIISTPNVTNYSFILCKIIAKKFFKKINTQFLEESKKEFLYKTKVEVKQEENHINLKNMDDWKKIFINSGFTILDCRRGSMFYGSKYIDKHPVIFIIITFFDIIFDIIPCFKKWSYNFFLVMKN